ncbi:hypothetical protein ACU18_02315 [Arthrobacter sp. ZBG10]|nr:hypothetical protein ACU18_02315 [Arthrobacter sp. ZBG10]KQR03787.1 hypothetical protein ASF72_05575 [Arthrobacter sp. Leaf141]
MDGQRIVGHFTAERLYVEGAVGGVLAEPADRVSPGALICPRTPVTDTGPDVWDSCGSGRDHNGEAVGIEAAENYAPDPVRPPGVQADVDFVEASEIRDPGTAAQSRLPHPETNKAHPGAAVKSVRPHPGWHVEAGR